MSRCRVFPVLAIPAVLAASLAFIPLPQTKPAAKVPAQTRPEPAKPAGQAKADAPKPAAKGEDPSGSYEIDAVHSSVVFRVKHMNVSWFYGRFNEVAGSIVLDTAHPEKSSVDLAIPIASIDTNNEKRNQHLLSPDFFSAKEFPDIGFKSDKVKALKDGVYEVTGKLSMHGESKPLTVQVELAGSAPGGGDRPGVAGFETTFTVKRSDFGMSNMLGMLGDEVRVTISVEAGKSG